MSAPWIQPESEPEDVEVPPTSSLLTGGTNRSIPLRGSSYKQRHRGEFLTAIDNYFSISHLDSSFHREIVGGISTFLVSLYILTEEPNVLSDGTDMNSQSVFIATCIISGLGSIAMGIFAKVPIVIAPGMGLNDFFSYFLIGKLGIHWQTALGYVFVESVILVMVVFFIGRMRLLAAFPDSIRVGIGVGITLDLAFVGLARMSLYRSYEGVLYVSYELVLGIFTILVIVLLLHRWKIRSSYIWGVLLCTAMSVVIRAIFKRSELGLDWGRYDVMPTLGKLNFDFDLRALYIIPLLLLQHLIDNCITVMTLLQIAYLGFGDSLNSDFTEILTRSERTRNALIVSSATSVVGSVLGTSSVTSFIESSIGITVGARTGLAAVVTGVLFLAGVFLGPVFLLVPPEATGPVLFLTAMSIFPVINKLDLSNLVQSTPALFAAFVIPFTSMIAAGSSLSYVVFFVCRLIEGDHQKPQMWLLFVLALMHVSLNLFLTNKVEIDHHVV